MSVARRVTAGVRCIGDACAPLAPQWSDAPGVIRARRGARRACAAPMACQAPGAPQAPPEPAAHPRVERDRRSHGRRRGRRGGRGPGRRARPHAQPRTPPCAGALGVAAGIVSLAAGLAAAHPHAVAVVVHAGVRAPAGIPDPDSHPDPDPAARVHDPAARILAAPCAVAVAFVQPVALVRPVTQSLSDDAPSSSRGRRGRTREPPPVRQIKIFHFPNGRGATCRASRRRPVRGRGGGRRRPGPARRPR